MYSDLEDDDDRLRCNICTECFDKETRTPKMLLCNHTFCFKCLTQYALNKPALPCPTCRRETIIGKKGVKALRSNNDFLAMVSKAQRFARDVFYSDDSGDESHGDKKSVNLWCENCLKIADPICMIAHDTCFLERGIKRLKDKLSTVLEDTKQILAEQALLLEAHLDVLLTTQEACTRGITQELEGKINARTQALLQVRSQLNSLSTTKIDDNPSSLVKILHGTESQSEKLNDSNKIISNQFNVLSAMNNCCVSVKYRVDSQDEAPISFKMQELPREHQLMMSYILYGIKQKKIQQNATPKPQVVPQQKQENTWQHVRGRREKKNSISGNSRASSRDSLVNLSSSSRTFSVDSLVSTNLRANPHSVINNNDLTKCFFDITLNDEPLGRVVIQLRPDVAPRMCANFVALCVGRQGFGYKGCKIFKTHPNDHILGGDFVNNDGTGGHSIYNKKGWFLADKCGLKDEIGAVRMRGMGMDESTGLGLVGSQFHIWVGKRFFRPYPRTLVIGKVVEGIEICQQISRLKSGKNSDGNHILLDSVVIASCGKL